MLMVVQLLKKYCASLLQHEGPLSASQETSRIVTHLSIQYVHLAGLLDVQNILSEDTGISRKLNIIHSAIT
jgi:hypothetical protein